MLLGSALSSFSITAAYLATEGAENVPIEVASVHFGESDGEMKLYHDGLLPTEGKVSHVPNLGQLKFKSSATLDVVETQLKLRSRTTSDLVARWPVPFQVPS